MVKQITKDSDVIEASRREEGKRFLTWNSRMKDVIMLKCFLFSYVIGNLINLCADEGKPVDNLFTGQRKEKLEYSKKSEHILEEPKDQLQTQSWKTWLKGLFKMRTLPRFISWVSIAIPQKNTRKRAHGQEP